MTDIQNSGVTADNLREAEIAAQLAANPMAMPYAVTRYIDAADHSSTPHRGPENAA